jgi:hypothetical protein
MGGRFCRTGFSPGKGDHDRGRISYGQRRGNNRRRSQRLGRRRHATHHVRCDAQVLGSGSLPRPHALARRTTLGQNVPHNRTHALQQNAIRPRWRNNTIETLIHLLLDPFGVLTRSDGQAIQENHWLGSQPRAQPQTLPDASIARHVRADNDFPGCRSAVDAVIPLVRAARQQF